MTEGVDLLNQNAGRKGKLQVLENIVNGHHQSRDEGKNKIRIPPKKENFSRN